jgi:hypothetical protein
MYNEKVAEFLQKKYGDENFKIYCQMEAEANDYLTAEIKNVQGHNSGDHDYDAFWWKNRLEELLNQENH